MARYVALLLCALTASLLNAVEAKEVVVFVHGLGGFGPDELGPINYWNHLYEFSDSLFDVYEATVGPVSSNWDRACELYAQIKGTVVDYGAAHSSRFGHSRYGRDYTGQGFYPEWSANKRIHLVGHSMGGMTIRLLEILLQEGDAAEVAATGGSTSPLFSGSGNWVKSITTFSTPHDGSPLIDILGDDVIDLLEDLILTFAGVTGSTFITDFYDFELDHWGLGYQQGETFSQYFTRLKASPIFDVDNVDLAPYDLSPIGAKKLNERGQQSYPGTWYFAYSTEQTYSWWTCVWFNCGWAEYAEPTMWIFLAPLANALGSLSQPSYLRKNDGLVPEDSSECPKLGYSSYTCSSYQGTWASNRWYYEHLGLDHLQVIGFTLVYSLVADEPYEDLAYRLYLLGQATSSNAIISAPSSQQDSAPGLSSAVIAGIAVASVGVIATAGIMIRRRYRGQSMVTLPERFSIHRGVSESNILERGGVVANNPRFQE